MSSALHWHRLFWNWYGFVPYQPATMYNTVWTLHTVHLGILNSLFASQSRMKNSSWYATQMEIVVSRRFCIVYREWRVTSEGNMFGWMMIIIILKTIWRKFTSLHSEYISFQYATPTQIGLIFPSLMCQSRHFMLFNSFWFLALNVNMQSWSRACKCNKSFVFRVDTITTFSKLVNFWISFRRTLLPFIFCNFHSF